LYLPVLIRPRRVRFRTRQNIERPCVTIASPSTATRILTRDVLWVDLIVLRKFVDIGAFMAPSVRPRIFPFRALRLRLTFSQTAHDHSSWNRGSHATKSAGRGRCAACSNISGMATIWRRARRGAVRRTRELKRPFERRRMKHLFRQQAVGRYLLWALRGIDGELFKLGIGIVGAGLILATMLPVAAAMSQRTRRVHRLEQSDFRHRKASRRNSHPSANLAPWRGNSWVSHFET
jgi:hypothetical protein